MRTESSELLSAKFNKIVYNVPDCKPKIGERPEDFKKKVLTKRM